MVPTESNRPLAGRDKLGLLLLALAFVAFGVLVLLALVSAAGLLLFLRQRRLVYAPARPAAATRFGCATS